jgi:hypothetical protein
MLAHILTLTLVFGQSTTAQSPQVRFSATTDLVIVELFYLRAGKPVAGLTTKDFALTVDRQTRAIESVEYVTDAGKKPYYLLAFRPTDAERGTGPRAAEITATIDTRDVKAVYRFTLPARWPASQTPRQGSPPGHPSAP